MAELHLIPGSKQLGPAARVFAASWALRSALTEPAPASIGGTTVIRTPAPPLSCRLRLWHKWQWVTTEDGGRYEACMRCGRDRSRPHQSDAGHVRWGNDDVIRIIGGVP